MTQVIFFLYRLLIKLASTFYKYLPIIYPNYILSYYCSIILSNVVVQNFTQSIETRASPIVHSCLELKQEPLIMMRMAPYFHTKKVGKKLPRLQRTKPHLNFRPKNRKRPSLSTSLYVFTDNFDGTAKSLKALITAQIQQCQYVLLPIMYY